MRLWVIRSAPHFSASRSRLPVSASAAAHELLARGSEQCVLSLGHSGLSIERPRRHGQQAPAAAAPSTSSELLCACAAQHCVVGLLLRRLSTVWSTAVVRHMRAVRYVALGTWRSALRRGLGW